MLKINLSGLSFTEDFDTQGSKYEDLSLVTQILSMSYQFSILFAIFYVVNS